MNSQKINITIPTYNRDYCIRKAIDSALHQSYQNITVTVVDDGSSDNTPVIMKEYLDDSRVCYIQLAHNVGTAQAKNVSILLSDYDAITFHDSDDIPVENKILMQARAMFQTDHKADPILNWGPMGYDSNQSLEISVVVGAHKMIKLDSSIHTINKHISLTDDFFPNLQFPSKTEGDWILINSGLFRKNVFEELGGYMDSVEEDREIRNRTIGCGYLYYYLEEPLLTKIETGVSLTVSEDTGYQGMQRQQDRNRVWERIDIIRKAKKISQLKKELMVPVDLSDVKIKYISNPEILKLNHDIPHRLPTDGLFMQKKVAIA
jgi:glycosyltransferase involved in cell wall biosynthesis